MKLTKLIGGVSALVLTGLALVLFIEEYDAFRLSRETDRGQYEQLVTGDVSSARSVRALREVMQACDDGQRSVFGRVQSTLSRHAVADECLSLAAAILSQAPTWSFAHYVVALSHFERGEREGFNTALGLSQRSGPFEGWIAQRRFSLAVEGFEQLDEAALAATASDTAMLIASRVGVDLIADRYARNVEIRDWVLSVAEALPAQDQRRFLARVADTLGAIDAGGEG